MTVNLAPGIELLQVISFIFAIATLIINVMWIASNKNKWRYALPIATLMLHSVLYYTFLFVFRALQISTDFPLFTIWSAILRFHTLAALLTVEVSRPGILKWIKARKEKLLKMRVREQ